MSKAASDQTSIDFLKDLNHWRTCPRPGCGGTLIEILVKYGTNPRIFTEFECDRCSRVVKTEGRGGHNKRPGFGRFDKRERKPRSNSKRD